MKKTFLLLSLTLSMAISAKNQTVEMVKRLPVLRTIRIM
jgi:hypothetical protein